MYIHRKLQDITEKMLTCLSERACFEFLKSKGKVVVV